MTARCCIYYIDSEGLKTGLVTYSKGKISLLDRVGAGNTRYLLSFELSYGRLARELQYAVLSGSVEPVVVPGLFLKSSNVTRC